MGPRTLCNDWLFGHDVVTMATNARATVCSSMRLRGRSKSQIKVIK